MLFQAQFGRILLGVLVASNCLFATNLMAQQQQQQLPQGEIKFDRGPTASKGIVEGVVSWKNYPLTNKVVFTLQKKDGNQWVNMDEHSFAASHPDLALPYGSAGYRFSKNIPAGLTVRVRVSLQDKNSKGIAGSDSPELISK